MREYIIRRLLLVPVTIIIVSFLVFSLTRLIPGDIVDLMFEEKGYAKDVEEMREKLGLNKPIYIQYFIWAKNILKGEWGESLWSKDPVLQEIGKRWPVTLQLGIMSLVIALSVGIPIGTYSAMRQDTAGDYILRSYSIILLSTPAFWLAILLVVVPTLWLEGWRAVPPYVQFTENPLVSIRNMILPAFCMGAAMSGTSMRMTRTMMLEVLRQDYIRTAWAKGLSERIIIPRHAIKNALIPIVTLIGAGTIFLMGGSVIIEQIFMLPGLGRHMFHSIMQRDYPMVSGINLVICSCAVFLNLIIDISYAYLDPRIRYR
ncbi:MAG: ABC transporter permease [Deltaproteobacteria bacterium]|nr:ABC transporter permease [Deltaproteobacteria bacterium]